MPRRSAASLSVIPTALPQRPAPPKELTREQAKEWVEIVGSLPISWFAAGAQALLVQYCRHLTTARVLARAIDAIDTTQLGDRAVLRRYGILLGAAQRESKALINLGRALRLNPQSRMRAETAGRAAAKAGPSRKPWETHA
jgi:hypothetical protein